MDGLAKAQISWLAAIVAGEAYIGRCDLLLVCALWCCAIVASNRLLKRVG